MSSTKNRINLTKQVPYHFRGSWYQGIFVYFAAIVLLFGFIITATSSIGVSQGSNVSKILTINSINEPTDHEGSFKNGNMIGCNCIVFRMDDIQDYWLNEVQKAVMNLFLNKSQTISLGLIMNSIGNDSKIIESVKEGVDRDLFELSLHGWNHTEYVNLTKQEQQDSLIKSNNKMNHLFERKSSTFIPPLSVFNNDTLRAMADAGLSIISSDIPEETKFNDGRSIFIAKNLENSNSSNLIENQNGLNQSMYHLPATIFFKDYEKGKWIKTPNDEIISNSTKNIENYGYSIIVLHPQDFALTSNKTSPLNFTYVNTVNTTEIGDISKLIDSILREKIRITGFDQIVTEYGK